MIELDFNFDHSDEAYEKLLNEWKERENNFVSKPKYSLLQPRQITLKHIIESNAIENVYDPGEVPKSIIAWEFLTRQPRLDGDVIKRVHREIMAGLVPAEHLGQWRPYSVNVKGSNEILSHPIVIAEQIADWTRFLNNRPEGLSPRAMHVWFERIHPFVDGNGRVGRMLMWYHEMRIGQWATLIEKSEEESYYQWFHNH